MSKHQVNLLKRLGAAATIAVPFILVLGGWQLLAIYGGFNAKLVPNLRVVAATFLRLSENGILIAATEATLSRLLMGFSLAALFGVAIGILMGRRQWVEEMLLPLISFIYPIPGIAYAPLFILWFGLGNTPAILLVAVASTFPVIINAWKGVTAVKPIWIKSAESMGARGLCLFWKIIIPGALPYILTGLRLGLATAWRILVAVEMLTSVKHGLGWLIFGSQAFLDTDVMLATIVVIGLIGFTLEKLVFETIERMTVVRWGMLTA
ncbi:MAG: ABC transporter permease [Candidimonas sp.]|nr:MAG: ABC transporter permease [Candidimonas sp.]TAM19142.1 MAG: ABC transporter permease [Candidimonas sp.]TAM76560.1 MAG: ABC transporter permease [Candidimonas sp.]